MVIQQTPLAQEVILPDYRWLQPLPFFLNTLGDQI